jgi:hypothetical protein
MKLYFAPAACSLSPHIVLREVGASFDLEQVDIGRRKPNPAPIFGPSILRDMYRCSNLTPERD